MNIRVSVIAVPVIAMLAAASAGASTVTLTPLGSAHPQQIAALGASCAVPYSPAQMVAPSMQYPAFAELMGTEGIATVGITLSPAGRVTRAWRIQSTGNAFLDRAAIYSAELSEFVAERVQCNAVGGDYKIEVDFSLDR